MSLLAQSNIPQNPVGQDLLQQAIKLSQDTANSWDLLWSDLINSHNDLWRALCVFGLILAALSLIFVALKIAAENVKGNTFLAEFSESMIWSLVVFLFLTGNGFILSNTVLLLRDVANSQITNVLNIQLASLTMRQALQTVSLSSSGQDRIEAILAQCQGQSSLDFADCIQEQQPYIDQVIQDVESQNGEALQGLRNWASNLLSGMSTFVYSIPYSVMKSIFYAMQWAFVNVLEASLIMTATLAPVAVGISLLPVGSRALWAWGIGFMSLFTVQLGYNIIVGIGAVVAVNTDVFIVNELGFLIFISVFSPGLAVLLGAGGGVALFKGIGQYSATAAQFASDAIAGLTTGLIKLFI